MRNKIVKKQKLDPVKFCFGHSASLSEGRLGFLFEEDEKPDTVLNKFWTNFLNLANSSKGYFPNLMGSIPRDMKLRFQSVEDLEELQNIYSSFNHFTQVFQNVCEEVNDLVSSKSDNENLKDAIPNLREVVKGNFIPEKALNKRFEIFKKRLSSYIGDDYNFRDRKKDQPPLLQKIVAAALDTFIANPRNSAGTDKNLKLIFGGKLASDLMYRDLSSLSVEKFKKGYSEFIDEYNRIAGSLFVPKMDAPETDKTEGGPEEKTPEEKTPEEKNLWDMMISGKTKNFRKTKVDPRIKKIKKQLDSLNSNWTAIKADPNEKYKSDFLKDLKSLRDSLSDMKLERKNLKTKDLIVERWIKMAGLEDKHE